MVPALRGDTQCPVGVGWKTYLFVKLLPLYHLLIKGKLNIREGVMYWNVKTCREDWEKLERELENAMFSLSEHYWFSEGVLIDNCLQCGLSRIEWIEQFEVNVNGVDDDREYLGAGS